MTQLVNFAYSEDPWFFDTKCHICETLSVTIRIWFCLFFMELDNVPQNRLSFLIAFLKCRIQWMPVAVAAICMHIHCYIFLFYLNQASFCKHLIILLVGKKECTLRFHLSRVNWQFWKVSSCCCSRKASF